MKRLVCVAVLAASFMVGCANHPTVYVYGKYLDNKQKESVKRAFEGSEQFNIEFNEFDFPVSITQNSLLYSPLLQHPDAISIASALSASAGFPVQRTQGLTQGNHWYTKDSLALYLLPEDIDVSTLLVHRDLAKRYQPQGCPRAIALTLHPDGKFNLQTKEDKQHVEQVITGKWKYRQYPFIELQKDGDNYSEYYFEIKQFKGADQVSEIHYLQLVSLNPGYLSPGCSFVNGTRL
ncbi:hypothetical protein [Alteromonas gilva]|uniref:Lipoprotein n=1 Tax=Alteromonas gilva TaxID=2987522 RepID=A0ABT5KX10_9ALTE|nr:hypothetical protein [Alteromonas gilva]MDC8829291.1 hypothetical protein [Alteromonas gilva]